MSLLGLLGGSLVLLTLLAWAWPQDPSLGSVDYALAVVDLLATRATWVTLAAVATCGLSLAHLLRGFLLDEADERQRRAVRPTFWAAFAVCGLWLLGLLLAVCYVSYESGSPKSLRAWVDR